MNLKFFIAVAILINSVSSVAQSTYVSPYGGSSFSNQFSFYPNVLNGVGPYGQQLGITQQLDFLGSSIGTGYSYYNNLNDLFFGGLPGYNQPQSSYMQPMPSFNQFSMFSNPAMLQQQFIQPFTNTLNQIMSREPVSIEETSSNTDSSSSDDDSTVSKDQADRANQARCEMVKRDWRDGECRVPIGLNEDECFKLPATSWLDKTCVENPKDAEECLKYSDAIYLRWICYNSKNIGKESCAEVPDMEWKDNSCLKRPSLTLSADRGDCPQSEAEVGYRFETKCGIISVEDCLNESKHGGHSASWYHGSCWDLGCYKEEKVSDPFCVAAKSETMSRMECLAKKGIWTEAKRDGNNWVEGTCADPVASSDSKVERPSKDGKPESSYQGSFSLYVTGDLDFLKSEKKTDGQYPKFNLLQSCLQNLNGLQDRNLQYSNDNEQFSFRDIKKGQIGVSFVENKTAFFVEEKELIKIRDDSCKDEIKKAILVPNLEKGKLYCSVNFSVGDSTYTVKFQKGNILANSPQYLITDAADGDYDSEYSAPEQDIKKINYKNLYLGIENAFRSLTSRLRENCPKDPKKFSSDAYIGKLLNFSGSCDGVLTTGWRDQDIDPKLEDDLKDAIKACRARTKIQNHNSEVESTSISK